MCREKGGFMPVEQARMIALNLDSLAPWLRRGLECSFRLASVLWIGLFLSWQSRSHPEEMCSQRFRIVQRIGPLRMIGNLRYY
jgi:hypothetical protein